MKSIALFAALAALTTGSIAAAASINVRQINQKRLIDAGKRSGKLTRSEAHQLDAEQRAITRLHNQLLARHGHHLTKYDKARIDALQAQAARHIARQKHDAQRGRNQLKL